MRPQAREKLGYYPAPMAAIQMIAARLDVHPLAVFLDPCAGAGDAIIALAENTGLFTERVYGVELEGHRGDKIRESLGEENVLAPCDYLSAEISEGPSLVYLNPPFDDEMGGGLRVEQKFLERALTQSKPGCFFVVVVPEKTARNYEFRRTITTFLDGSCLEPFPESCRVFNEVVIYGRRTEHPIEVYANLDRPMQGQRFHVGEGVKPKRFRKTEMTDEELSLHLETERPSLLRAERDSVTAKKRPPLELGTGHLALLLASGHLDGLVKKPGHKPHVVRGTARKEEYVVSREKEQVGNGAKVTETRAERIVLSIRFVDRKGVIRTLDQSDSSHSNEDAESEFTEKGVQDVSAVSKC